MKTGQCVWLPVHPELQAALDILPAPRGGECGYFFWSGNGAKESMVRAAERTLSAVFAKSEVMGAHAHRFRHTLATELLEQGWTYEDVAEVLGNSAAIVKKHYAKWSRGRQDRLTVYQIETRCRNPGCHCAQAHGRLHPATVLSWSEGGRTRMRSLGVDQRTPVRRLSEQYRRLRQARAAVVRIQQQMLQDIDRLEQALRLPPPPPAARRPRAARPVPRRPRG